MISFLFYFHVFAGYVALPFYFANALDILTLLVMIWEYSAGEKKGGRRFDP
jgi:hypothetical protein